jgi:hypothetical protein
LCLYGLDPSLSFQGVFHFSEGWRLHCDELGIRGDLIRPLVVGPMRQPSVHLLGDLLLRLQDLAQHLGLGSHEGLLRRHGWWWRQVTATVRSETVG